MKISAHTTASLFVFVGALALITSFLNIDSALSHDELPTQTASVVVPAHLATTTHPLQNKPYQKINSSAKFAATSTNTARKSPTSKPIISTSTSSALPQPNPTTKVSPQLAVAPPESVESVNVAARGALVNIFCTPNGGSFNPTSGSGVVVDPRGVILTNAHVAQYVLLSEDPRVNLNCSVRTGAPATVGWSVEVLYIPPVWVAAHANEIRKHQVTGTGEHDWALLRITSKKGTDSLPHPPSPLPFDTHENAWVAGDQVLVAGYPAEFVGGTVAQNNLFPVTSVATIQKLLTFASSTVDVLSLGGVIEAQSGSSGGAVVDVWGRLIGIITTTSEGTTTAARDLHATTISYINRDIKAQTGNDLIAFLEGDLAAKKAAFKDTAHDMISQYVKVLDR